jgi:UDPglucose 6-dehydrogenase
MRIAIIGSGYVGLVTGACFSEIGIDVQCVDVDQVKIDNLKKGIIPIYEPGLEKMITKNIEEGRLQFTTNLSDALKGSDVVFISIGTPPDEDGSADLMYVLQVARDCGKHMTDYTLVVTKSTVPVGTSKKVKKVIEEELAKRQVNIPFDVASNPDFLKVGTAIDDFLKPDRIVIGTENSRAQELLNNLYKPLTLNSHPIIFMDIVSAEMTKTPNFNIINKLLNSPAIFDGRNIYDLAEMKRKGFDHFCIGVNTTNPVLKLGLNSICLN